MNLDLSAPAEIGTDRRSISILFILSIFTTGASLNSNRVPSQLDRHSSFPETSRAELLSIDRELIQVNRHLVKYLL